MRNKYQKIGPIGYREEDGSESIVDRSWETLKKIDGGEKLEEMKSVKWIVLNETGFRAPIKSEKNVLREL